MKVGHAPQQRTLEVGSGKERRISFTLEALRGDLAIQTQPEDAQLWIDGEHQGGAAGTVRLAAVPHEIEIKKEGYASYRKDRDAAARFRAGVEGASADIGGSAHGSTAPRTHHQRRPGVGVAEPVADPHGRIAPGTRDAEPTKSCTPPISRGSST